MTIDRRLRLQTIKLLGRCIRVGHTRTCGPIYTLESFDHSADTFKVRNVHTRAMSKIHLDELTQAITDGIAHVSRIAGSVYLA